jgi:hypothetical protein
MKYRAKPRYVKEIQLSRTGWAFLYLLTIYFMITVENSTNIIGLRAQQLSIKCDRFRESKFNSRSQPVMAVNSTHTHTQTYIYIYIYVFNGNLSSRKVLGICVYSETKNNRSNDVWGVFYNLTNSRILICNSMRHCRSFWYLNDIFCARFIYILGFKKKFL